MSVATATPKDTLQLDFLAACADLQQAQRARRAKDTAVTRARVQECKDRIDRILDMSNNLARDRG
jgi:hypothetical protein